MRYRVPRVELNPPEIQRPVLHEFAVELITPMYGGGVKAGQPDQKMPIRASSIRGQLRFWWRLINATRYSSSEVLFREERKIFGGLGSDEKSVTASCFRLRVKLAKPVTQSELTKAGIPNYAIAVVLTGKDKDAERVVPVGTRFTLQILMKNGLEDSVWPEIREALRFWASFGGLGARTRRGLGAVKIHNLAPISEDEAEARNCRLVLRNGASDNPNKTWKDAIDKLREFRQGENIARPPANPPKKPFPGRSFWPEPDAIRRLTREGSPKHIPAHQGGNTFPRAYFGMPILFHFKNDKPMPPPKDREPRDTTLVPKGAERFASPLILRTYWDGQKYRSAAFVMTTSVQALSSKQLSLKRADRDFLQHQSRWIPTAEEVKHIPPMQEQGGGNQNPLDAFLHFFQRP